jgi:tetratricopeptide (TPR) repeat protein
MPESPYRAGNPVGGSPAFVGREDILRRVLRVLANPDENAIVLYGQRRIGKSSVLQELAARLTDVGAYSPVYFDLQDKAARSLDAVLMELAQRIATQLGAPTPVGWAEDAQARFKNEFLPQILERLPSSHSLVLLFDEFDVLDGPSGQQAGAAFFPYLRDLLALSPRLQFVFVIGRRPEELSTLTLSVFKGVPSERISLLDESETTKLITLSQANGTLIWTQDTSAEVFRLAGGHPFLTQQLCQEIWEKIHDNEDAEYHPIENLPTVTIEDVNTAVPAALRSATNALEWLWNGLGPAARIVASALAGAGVGVISQEELEHRLHESGVRLLIGELRNAPRTLQDWDLIEPVDGGYRFRVEMLRRWIADNKPLFRVQAEIDYVQPLAENLFQAAYSFYQSGQLNEALTELRRVVLINPNHLRGTELLAELLIVEDELGEARLLLERLYQHNPAVARPRLVQVLGLQAQKSVEAQTQLALYERILQLEPSHVEATDFVFRVRLAEVETLEKSGDYKAALDLTRQLYNRFPTRRSQLPDIDVLKQKTHLADLYSQARIALDAQRHDEAISMLIDVIRLEPHYAEATHLLHLAVTSEDVNKLMLEGDIDSQAGTTCQVLKYVDKERANE